MGRVGQIVRYETGPDGASVVVRVDGVTNYTASLFRPAGDKSLPLVGEDCLLVELPGKAGLAAVGFSNVEDDSSLGEVRHIARNALGAAVAEMHLHDTGDVSITSLQPTGAVTINGLRIDALGNVTTTGTIAAGAITAASLAASGSLSAGSVTAGSVTADSVTADSVTASGVGLGTHTHAETGTTTAPGVG